HSAAGMVRVAEETGAELAVLEKSGFKKIDIPNGKRVRSIHRAAILDEVDAVVNVCKLKTHMQTLMTGAMKNMFGLTTSQDRIIAHRNSGYVPFSEAIVDIFSAMPPKLNIMDAVVGMDGTGPAQGTPRRFGFLLASGDAVALDTVAAVALGFRPDEIAMIESARKRNLGASRLSQINIVGDSLSSVKIKARRPSSAISFLLPFVTNSYNELTKVRPVINKDKCKACGKCGAVCPAEAISFPGKSARIDDGRCLLCYCCHEICPHDAVDLNKSFLVKIAEMISG
ncbi:MAG TPA: DUF362 domain-containing protein, partial [bacterium]|nr:DUF362 domain-containing protein [bacterium]